MRLTSLLAFITACAATLNAEDLPGRIPSKTPTAKIAFSTSLLPPPPLGESNPPKTKPKEKVGEGKSLGSEANEPTGSPADRMPLFEERLTSSVGSLYDARAIEKMMEYKTAESLDEWSIFAKSTWDLGVLGVWEIGQGEIDPVNEESTRASIGLKPLRPIINPEIAFTDRIRLSQFDGLKVFLDDKHILSIGIKADTHGGTLGLKWRF